jgi:hypothetical protein
MHGTEHCNRERRTFRLSAPLKLGFPRLRINASWLAAACFSLPGPASRNGLSLACNGSRFHEPLSRVNGPDLLLRCLAASFPARSALLLHHRTPVRPGFGRFLASGPLLFRLPLRLTASPISTPLRGFYFPSGSKRSTGLAACRPAFRIRPISSRSPLPVLFQVWLRITVPGSLRFRRLAVPQTSWNLFHYAPEAVCRQRFFVKLRPISSTSICLVSNRLRATAVDNPVDKTRSCGFVLFEFKDHAVLSRQPQIVGVGR